MGIIPPISPKLNFTPNTLGGYGLTMLSSRPDGIKKEGDVDRERSGETVI